MIIPDLNLLIYSYDSSSSLHAKAKNWWEDVINSEKLIGLPWIVILGFLRLTTTRNIFLNPLSTRQATQIISSWCELSQVEILHPGNRHLLLLADILESSFVLGGTINDAHLAVLAIENNATIYSNDTDFKRFSGVKVINPLI